MDIKLKNIKKKKYFSWLVYIVMFVSLSVGMLSLAEIEDNLAYIDKEDLYWESGLYDIMNQYKNQVLDYGLYYKNKTYASDKNNITTQDRIICENEINETINLEYQNVLNKYYNSVEFQTLTDEEQTSILKAEKEKISEKHNLTEEELQDYIIKRKANSEKNKRIEITKYKNLDFVVHDVYNDIWIGGSSQKDIERIRDNSKYFIEMKVSSNGYSDKTYIDGELEERYSNIDSGYETQGIFIDSTIKEYSLEIYVGMNKNVVDGDVIYSKFQSINSGTAKMKDTGLIILISLIISGLGIFIIRECDMHETVTVGIINKFKDYKLEYKFLVAAILILTFVMREKLYYSNYIETLTTKNIVVTTIVVVIGYILARICMVNYKDRTLLSNNITGKMIKNIFYVMSNGSIFKTIIIIALGYIVMALVLIFIGLVFLWPVLPICFIIGVIVTLGLIIFTTQKIIYLDQIMISTKEGAEGKLINIEESGKGQLRDFAHNINTLKDGLRVSIENEFKSEKLKTELITNVSHDLKTPLTSIINYIDLLKREELESEIANDYINVLDRKSKRLQILIEDLFEASKAASGAIELNIEEIDIAQLVNQALGENNEKLLEAGLSVKANIPNEKIYINGDGKRLYRVFENLIVNISKYSMKNTRVYIDLIKDDENILIIMKNISSYELNFDVDEITDRFKRGDEARSTEGSGLGLAISKSIMELHNGSLNIEVDGDLFKAIIKFSN